MLARHTLDYGPGNTADFESEALLTEGKAGFLGNTGRYASHALELPRVMVRGRHPHRVLLAFWPVAHPLS